MELGRIAIIGGGHMGAAICGGLANACGIDPARICVANPGEEKRAALAARWGVRTTACAAEALPADTVVLAVRPNVVADVCAELAQAGLARTALVISVAAGVSTAALTHALGREDADGAAGPEGAAAGAGDEAAAEGAGAAAGADAGKQTECATGAGAADTQAECAAAAGADSPSSSPADANPLVRVMPNAPLAFGAGVAGISPADRCPADALETARALFERLGGAVVVPEEQQDLVTAVSGSGPAYFELAVSAMANAAEELGMAHDAALALALNTMYGTAVMLRETGDDPADALEVICTKGGTTEAALQAMRALHVEDAFAAGIRAAAARSRELGR